MFRLRWYSRNPYLCPWSGWDIISINCYQSGSGLNLPNQTLAIAALYRWTDRSSSQAIILICTIRHLCMTVSNLYFLIALPAPYLSQQLALIYNVSFNTMLFLSTSATDLPSVMPLVFSFLADLCPYTFDISRPSLFNAFTTGFGIRLLLVLLPSWSQS